MRPRRARLGCLAELYVDANVLGDFNEAEARAPRMQFQAPPRRDPPARTSMRPRRARLGCHAVRMGHIPRLYALQ